MHINLLLKLWAGKALLANEYKSIQNKILKQLNQWVHI